MHYCSLDAWQCTITRGKYSGMDGLVLGLFGNGLYRVAVMLDSAWVANTRLSDKSFVKRRELPKLVP